MNMTKQQEQVDRNFEAFKEKLPEIIGTHRGKFALMKDGEIIAFYSTAEDAEVTGNHFFRGEPFSIQEVTNSAIDLGYFSHALNLR